MITALVVIEPRYLRLSGMQVSLLIDFNVLLGGGPKVLDSVN